MSLPTPEAWFLGSTSNSPLVLPQLDGAPEENLDGLRGHNRPLETIGMIPKTRWAKTMDGTYIAYQDFGEGPITLVVIHGWVSYLELYWQEPRFARFMQRLAERMRVLNFDKRGTGMSDRFERPPEVETINHKVGGIAVTIGARVGALAGGSEILVSQTVKDLVAGSGLAFEDRGEHQLKGVPGEWRLYAVVRD